MDIYQYTCDMGTKLIKASNYESAYRAALKEVGTCGGLRNVHLATESEIDWYKAMGGNI